MKILWFNSDCTSQAPIQTQWQSIFKYNAIFVLFDVERVRTTLSEVGPPVLNGGISTLLAFVLLVFSKSYVFQTFFKVRVHFAIHRLDCLYMYFLL